MRTCNISHRGSGGGWTGDDILPSASPPTLCLFAPLVRQRWPVAVDMWSVSLPTHDSLTVASLAGLVCLREYTAKTHV